MSNYPNQIFPMNSLREDETLLRGDYPLINFAVDFSAITLVTGTAVAQDNIPSPILAADVIGVTVVTNLDAAGLIYGGKVAAGTASGLKLTLSSSDATDDTELTGTAFVLGRMAPQ